MISYHPALDASNAVFRMTRLTLATDRPLEQLALRILDFYLLFPEKLSQFVFPSDLRKWRTSVIRSANPYFFPERATPVFVFTQMRAAQEHAISLMATKGQWDSASYAEGHLLLRRDSVPPLLAQKAMASSVTNSTLVTFLAKELSSIPLRGPEGLKFRSGLWEYRHDAR